MQGVAQESGWSAGVRPEEKLSVLALCCPHWVSWHCVAPTGCPGTTLPPLPTTPHLPQDSVRL